MNVARALLLSCTSVQHLVPRLKHFSPGVGKQTNWVTVSESVADLALKEWKRGQSRYRVHKLW